MAASLDVRGKKRQRHGFSGGAQCCLELKPEENYQWRMGNEKTIFGNDWTGQHALRRLA